MPPRGPRPGTGLEAENARLRQENAELRRELTEAREQQTATAQILRVIATSRKDAQPVIDAIVESAARWSRSTEVWLHLRERDALRVIAGVGHREHPVHVGDLVPVGDGQGTVARTLVEGRAIHVPDTSDRTTLRRASMRFPAAMSVLTVPLMREDEAIGVLLVGRDHVDPYTDDEIVLTEAFADQAVIAIDDARLFEELEQRNQDLSEALEQQTATADILRLVATSPTDVGPVIQGIVDAAVRLCGAEGGSIRRLVGDRFEGVVVSGEPFGSPDEPIMPFDGLSLIGRAVIDGRTIDTPDVGAVIDEYPRIEARWKDGLRSQVAVPLLSSGRPIGVLTVRSRQAHAFGAAQIALLETFADQAAIAIENARRFEELEQRNQDLSEALEQQTATADILRVIASSPSNLQVVLDTIARSAMQSAAASLPL